MLSLQPSIDPKIASIAPEFRALSIVVEATNIENTKIASEIMSKACKSVIAGEVSWADAHMQEWADVFRLFGAKPQRTPCSAEALRRRVLRDGSLPAIDPIVDLYNAVSIQYAVPVGGENLTSYVGTPRLTIADGSEQFDTMKDGVPAYEKPEQGEIIWRDDQGVTCRRWNWRQGVRTRLSAEDKLMWFILESLPAMPIEKLHEAGEALTDNLLLIMPGAKIQKNLVGFLR